MFNASFASVIIINDVYNSAGVSGPRAFLRYPHPKSLPSGKGLTIALPGSMRGVSRVLSLLMTFIVVREFQALALLLRYPHPKSLPSGKGLTITLTGSMRGVSRVLSCAKLFE